MPRCEGSVTGAPAVIPGATDPSPPAVHVGRGLTAGRRLAGRYRLVAALGEGAHATVWRARDELLGEDVALKVMRAPTGEEERLRVRAEVALARRVNHPSVGRIFDIGEEGDVRFVSMALIDGEGLRACLLRAAGDRAVRLRWVTELLRGAAAIHAAGIVHGDLKPENVVVDRAARAVIVDFGLARTPDSRSELRAHGTPAYMAPERWLGGRPDPRSDVFALGLLIGELLAPFPDALALAAPVRKRALSGDPADRPRDAGAMLAAWERAQRGWRPWRLGVVVTLALVAVVAAARFVGRPLKSEAPAPERLVEAIAADWPEGSDVRVAPRVWRTGGSIAVAVTLIARDGGSPPLELRFLAPDAEADELIDVVRQEIAVAATGRARSAERRRWVTGGTGNASARASMVAYLGLTADTLSRELQGPALALVEQALAADPDYVPALVEHGYLLLVQAHREGGTEPLTRAMADLERAAQLAPTDSRAASMVCRVRQFAAEETSADEREIERARAACQRAIALSDGQRAGVELEYLGRLHLSSCDLDRGLDALLLAADADPAHADRALEILVQTALAHGRTRLAADASRRLLGLEQARRRVARFRVGATRTPLVAGGVHLTRAAVLLRAGRFDEARVELLAEIAGQPREAWVEAAALRGLLALPDPPRAPELRGRLSQLEADVLARAEARPFGVQELAQAYALTDPPAALAWLDKLPAAQGCEPIFSRVSVLRLGGADAQALRLLEQCQPANERERVCLARIRSRFAMP